MKIEFVIDGTASFAFEFEPTDEKTERGIRNIFIEGSYDVLYRQVLKKYFPVQHQKMLDNIQALIQKELNK